MTMEPYRDSTSPPQEGCPECGKPSVSPPAEVFCVDCATKGWEHDAMSDSESSELRAVRNIYEGLQPMSRSTSPPQESDVRLPECVMERFTRGGAKWHVCLGEGSDTFQPILCHETEGINMPANRVRRQPTCIDCYRAWRHALVAEPLEETP